jgi:hypothetical protein
MSNSAAGGAAFLDCGSNVLSFMYITSNTARLRVGLRTTHSRAGLSDLAFSPELSTQLRAHWICLPVFSRFTHLRVEGDANVRAHCVPRGTRVRLSVFDFLKKLDMHGVDGVIAITGGERCCTSVKESTMVLLLCIITAAQ